MSGVQFNLLPDVKIKSLKAERTRNLVIGLSVLISGIALTIFVLTFLTVNIVQSRQLKKANEDIAANEAKLKAVGNLGQILTVRNQLQSLVSLHQAKHTTSRLPAYLPQITPTNVHLTSISLDLAQNLMTITGTANSHHAINTFIDTLKFTTYTTASNSTETVAFPSVVETSFGITPKNATYGLDVHFDPKLFSGTETPVLKVPKLTTTRSALEDPSNTLFNGQPAGGQR